MEVQISASKFMYQVNFFFQCYKDNKQFNFIKDWKFNWFNGDFIEYVKFEQKYNSILGINILYFCIYEKDVEPEVYCSCGSGSDTEIYAAIIKALEAYYDLKSDIYKVKNFK